MRDHAQFRRVRNAGTAVAALVAGAKSQCKTFFFAMRACPCRYNYDVQVEHAKRRLLAEPRRLLVEECAAGGG